MNKIRNIPVTGDIEHQMRNIRVDEQLGPVLLEKSPDYKKLPSIKEKVSLASINESNLMSKKKRNRKLSGEQNGMIFGINKWNDTYSSAGSNPEKANKLAELNKTKSKTVKNIMLEGTELP